MAKRNERELTHCPVCGEEYSAIYRKCPFCAENSKGTSGKHSRNKRGGGSSSGVVGKIIAVILILAIIAGLVYAALVYVKPMLEPEDKLESYSSTVTILEESKVEKVEISETAFELEAVGSTHTLTATVTPENASDIVIWSSSDSAIATVNEAGIVTAVTSGTAVIKATAGDKFAECVVSCVFDDAKAASSEEEPDDASVTVSTEISVGDRAVIVADSDGVRIRKGPDTGTDAVGSAMNGQVVKVTGIDGDWFKIEFNNGTEDFSGYVRGDFVQAN